MTLRPLTIFSAVLVSACAAAVPVALADSVSYGAQLSGKHESPPNDSPATGTAQMKFDTDTKELTWTVEYKDLTGDAIGAHIHGPAATGGNAGIMVPFPKTASPITGSAKLNDTQVQALQDGKLYVNIHTAAHPGGEVRGQLMKN